jgi:hypothetical protein
MMSIEYIEQLSRESGEVAERNDVVPTYLRPEELEEWRADFAEGIYPSFPFPDIGDYEPSHYELEETLFVDHSGFGVSGEPALTIGEFLEELEAGFYYAIVQTGQFQLYIGKFRYQSVAAGSIDEKRTEKRLQSHGR